MSTPMYQRLVEEFFGGIQPSKGDLVAEYTEVFKNPTTDELDEIFQRLQYGKSANRYCGAILASTGFYAWDRDNGVDHVRVYQQFKNKFGPIKVPLHVIEIAETKQIRLELAVFNTNIITGFGTPTSEVIQSLVDKHHRVFSRYGDVIIRPNYHDGE